MPRYAVTINGHTYEVASDHELSDSDAHQAALSQLATQHDTDTTSPGAGAAPGERPQPLADDEPSTYAGGFWKGLKDYGKDLVSDPRTMGMVGAGVASAALAPETGGLSLLIPALGAAGGAGVAHTIKQLRTGVPEDATDVAGSMAAEGGINAALAAVPGAARWAGPKLTARATRLAAQPDAARLTRHVAAGAATAMGHPSIGAMIEAIQSPTLNRAAGRTLETIGELPATASRMARRLGGAEAAPIAEQFTANRSGYRPGAVPEAPGQAIPGIRPSVEPNVPNTSGYEGPLRDAGTSEFSSDIPEAFRRPTYEPFAPNESGYTPGEVPDAPSSISALERQMMAKPSPEPWPQSPSRSTLKFGATEQPQELPFKESSGGSLDALSEVMEGPRGGRTGSPVADIAAERVGKNAPARQGKVTYRNDRGSVTIDYDNPLPNGAFPTEKIVNGKVDPFTTAMPEYQVPFLEDTDRMFRERAGGTIDVSPESSTPSLGALEQAMAPGQTEPSSKALADVMSGRKAPQAPATTDLRMSELQSKYGVPDQGIVEQVKSALRNLGFSAGTIGRTAEAAVSRGKTVEQSLKLALAELGQ